MCNLAYQTFSQTVVKIKPVKFSEISDIDTKEKYFNVVSIIYKGQYVNIYSKRVQMTCKILCLLTNKNAESWGAIEYKKLRIFTLKM